MEWLGPVPLTAFSSFLEPLTDWDWSEHHETPTSIQQNAPVEFHALKDAQTIFDVNYFGLMRVTQKFLPLLRQSKGRIINVSSILGALTVQELGVYSSSKHAMESLSDALRRELRPLDVSVSVVQPGLLGA